MTPSRPLVLQALDALNALDRQSAVSLLNQDLASTATSGERFSSIARLAQTIGELPIQLEASRRFAQTKPPSLDRILFFCKALNLNGRTRDAVAIVDGLPPQFQFDAKVDYFRGMLASQSGQFQTAEAYFRQALSKSPQMVEAWYGLTTITTARSTDDLNTMLALEAKIAATPPANHAQFLYALSKLYEDLGDFPRAGDVMTRAVQRLRGVLPPAPADALTQIAAQVETFSRGTFAGLKPSGCRSSRVIFVHGLPRSGTTLIEQTLAAHVAVTDGAETNLLPAALIPLGGYAPANMRAYQTRMPNISDPFGGLAETYLGMMSDRFGTTGRLVDKSLEQSAYMATLLHALPDAPILWIRRRPEDCALSCYRTFFGDQLAWSYDIRDIAAYFRAEDRLLRHLTALAPERILTVSYEDLVSNPQSVIAGILAHAGLATDPNVLTARTRERSVMTASVAQVRAPISTSRIGRAERYPQFQAAFRQAYAEG